MIGDKSRDYYVALEDVGRERGKRISRGFRHGVLGERKRRRR